MKKVTAMLLLLALYRWRFPHLLQVSNRVLFVSMNM